MSSELGGVVKFNCTVYGNTVPDINWFGIDGQILHDLDDKISITKTMDSSLITTSLLTLRNVSRADNGSYTCVVKNPDIDDTLIDYQRYNSLNYTLFVLGN